MLAATHRRKSMRWTELTDDQKRAVFEVAGWSVDEHLAAFDGGDLVVEEVTISEGDQLIVSGRAHQRRSVVMTREWTCRAPLPSVRSSSFARFVVSRRGSSLIEENPFFRKYEKNHLRGTTTQLEYQYMC